MDLRVDTGMLSANPTVEEPLLEREPSLPGGQYQTESGGTILVQLLEFKTHLLEAVEELHIRRDAETRFEDQISKLVLEKQELEWEKESFQNQIEMVAKQHKESDTNVRKQFQARIRSIEEEKEKFQVSAELKDKEINNLKEELKSLQLLKYNLEKKTSELEQKLALQLRSKDSHLNQLGEVEKRFSALSRQCTAVKQAHQELEQNVDEAMKINKKLTSVTEKQEATIVSLKKELEEVSNKLIKAQMASVRRETSCSPAGREQRLQQLQHKLNTEMEINKKLEREHSALREEKQEVMRCLQRSQQLLLSQTQTVSRRELEMQTQQTQFLALKQEHEVMREKSKAAEDKLARLMESHSTSRTSWDKEKAAFLDRIRSEQREMEAVNEAYGELQQKHAELSSQAKLQAQFMFEGRSSSPNHGVSTQVFPSLLEEVRGEETLKETFSEPPGVGGLQLLASTQTKKSDCLEDAGAVTQLVAIGAAGGRDSPRQNQQSEFKPALKPSELQTCELSTSSICILSDTTGCGSSESDKHINRCKTSERDPDGGSRLTETTSSVSDNGLSISKSSYASDASAAPSSSEAALDLQSKENGDEGMSEEEQGVKEDMNQCENEKKQWKKEQIQGEDVEEARGTTQETDKQEDIQRSAEDEGDTKRLEEETKDRAEAEERGKPEPHTPETQIASQTTADTAAAKSDTPPVIDFMESVCQKDSEKDADSSRQNHGYETGTETQSICSLCDGAHDCHDEVQHRPEFELKMEEKQADKSEVGECLVPVNHSGGCKSQAAAFPALPDDVSIQQSESTSTQTQPSNPDITSNRKQTDECSSHPRDGELVAAMVEPQALPPVQEVSEPECGQLNSLVAVNNKNDSSAEGQSNEATCEDDGSQTVQEPVEQSNPNKTGIDVEADDVDLGFEVETGSRQEQNDKVEDIVEAKMIQDEADSKPSAYPDQEYVLSETSSGKGEAGSPAGETLLDELRQPNDKSYRPSFDFGTKGSMAEKNTSGPGGFLGPPSRTLPLFLKSKAPLVITRASDLLNVTGVSRTAASSRTHQQGEWRLMGNACRDTTTRYEESRAPFPASTSSIPFSGPSRRTTAGCTGAPPPAAGWSSQLDWDLSSSQEREDQQSSFRSQISKIEQFLNMERLRLPKRRRTDD